MPSYSVSWSLTRFTLSLRDPRILAAELAVQADRPLGPEPHGRTCRLSTGVPAACRAAIGSTRDLAAGRTQRPDRRTRPVAPATAGDQTTATRNAPCGWWSATTRPRPPRPRERQRLTVVVSRRPPADRPGILVGAKVWRSW